ncbi:hypothetical protein BG000_008183 [Podila horticola]|nr:hypothetical protein BG000_008183 [Podila horticola]
MASHSTSNGNEIDEIEDIEGDSSDDEHRRPRAVLPRPANLQEQHSPSRRFVFPDKGYRQHQEKTSPKRLRPLSKHSKPKAPPAAIIQSSDSDLGGCQTHHGQATTPTKNGSVLSRSFRLGSGCNAPMHSIHPPAPLGARLQQLRKSKAKAKAEEIVIGDEIELTLTDELVAKQTASSARWGGIKRQRSPSPLPLDLVPARSRQTTAQTSPKSMINAIPFPNMILEQFPKVVPINQHKSVLVKPGRIHIFALVINIGPLEKTKSGYNNSKVSMTVCDTSVTSFKVTLWGKETHWVDLIKAGDVVLMTNLKLNEFQETINGNTTTDTNMARLDGSMLAQYRGHSKIEEILKELIKIRQSNAFHLLDTGIAREPSFFMTQAPDFFVRTPQNTSATTLTRYSRHASKTIAIGSASSCATTTSPTNAPISINACVRYVLLVTPKDVSTGWEIGAVLADGQMIQMKTRNDVSWINDMAPDRVFKFFGYCPTDDGELICLAVVEARLLGVFFSDPELQPSGDMRGFIQKYCLRCSSLAVTSSKEPSSFFCLKCDLDPAKRDSSQICWLYPRFELTLGDQPRVHHNLSKELIQARCHEVLGDQLFPSIPASQWMHSAESYTRSRSRWNRVFKLMDLNGHGSGDVVSESFDPPRVKVHLNVGRNDIFMATKLEYIWS